ncbi:uncharacterized protein [Ovis canadensis]|uniref:uncharacterized protein n=1 Tax=Ovis canadensis TaxID=37174 RepID=UPI0037520A66
MPLPVKASAGPSEESHVPQPGTQSPLQSGPTSCSSCFSHYSSVPIFAQHSQRPGYARRPEETEQGTQNPFPDGRPRKPEDWAGPWSLRGARACARGERMLAVRDGGAPRKGVPPRCRGLGAAQPSPAPRPPRGPSARRRGRNSSHFLCAERYRCCPKPPGIFRPPCPRPLLMEQTGRLFRALFSCTFILSNVCALMELTWCQE